MSKVFLFFQLNHGTVFFFFSFLGHKEVEIKWKIVGFDLEKNKYYDGES